jgi:hypothetical protein
MVAKKITLDEAPEWVMELREELREASIRGLQSAALRLLQHIQVTVIGSTRDERTGRGPPVDRGAYRASWRSRKVPTGSIVESTIPYAAVIEFGAKPENIVIGRAMIGELTEWVIRKGLAGKRPRGGAQAEFYVEARNIAWAIAVSMKKLGIFNQGKGLRVLERASKEIPRFVKDEVERELARFSNH